eukprot:scaffold13031_cov101-Isochrysis_galbana.AAC.3
MSSTGASPRAPCGGGSSRIGVPSSWLSLTVGTLKVVGPRQAVAPTIRAVPPPAAAPPADPSARSPACPPPDRLSAVVVNQHRACLGVNGAEAVAALVREPCTAVEPAAARAAGRQASRDRQVVQQQLRAVLVPDLGHPRSALRRIEPEAAERQVAWVAEP